MRQKRLIASNSEAKVYQAVNDAGEEVILKVSANAFLLQSEAKMLGCLAPFIKVPKVIALEADTLVTQYIPNDGSSTAATEIEIADAVAVLHNQSHSVYGFEEDTTIGPFRQPNGFSEQWIPFYREQRVMAFAREACNERRISTQMLGRIERFAGDFEMFLTEPPAPSLLHGDIWSGNVLTRNNRFAALIDPAVYYGHSEVELAFIAMFNTFSQPFYRRYSEHLRIEQGFFEERIHIYQLYPYLVHVRAFGGSYLNGIDAILKRFGY